MITLIPTGTPHIQKVAFTAKGERGPVEGYVKRRNHGGMWRAFRNNGLRINKVAFADVEDAARHCIRDFDTRALEEFDREIAKHVADIAAAPDQTMKRQSELALMAVMDKRNAIRPLG